MAHETFTGLRLMLTDAAAKVAVGKYYAHYKHIENLYKVTGFTVLEATDEIAVKYSPLSAPDVEFTRPLASWLETVTVDGKRVPRFARVG